MLWSSAEAVLALLGLSLVSICLFITQTISAPFNRGYRCRVLALLIRTPCNMGQAFQTPDFVCQGEHSSGASSAEVD
jgi:hypothetical protein